MNSLPFLVLILVLLVFTLQKLISLPPSTTTLKLPPGPPKLPFIGNLHLFAGFNIPPPATILRDLSTKYGPLMRLQLGEVTAVVVSSPESAKQVMAKHDTVFAFRPSLLATEVFCYGKKDVAFAEYGKYWTQLRKTCTMQFLSAKRVQSFKPLRAQEFSNLCRWIVSSEGSSINLTERSRW
ncbi:cytochrome P450, partial [Acinetobacter baumannii]